MSNLATEPFPVSERLPTEDAGFLYLETPEAPLHIGSVAVFDGPILVERCRAHIESKLPLIPRYRQRLIVPPLHMGHPTWEFDPNFDISKHVHHLDLHGGNTAELKAESGRIFGPIMDRTRPLWDVTVVNGIEHGHSALITRLHHCMLDGVAGIALLNVLMDPTPSPAHHDDDPVPPLPSGSGSLLDALISAPSEIFGRILSTQSVALDVAEGLLNGRAFRAWGELAGDLPELLTPPDRLPFNRPCRGPRKLAWTSVAIADVKAIRTACGGTLNDVVLVTLTRAIRRYAELHGEPIHRRTLRVMAPVNLRRTDNAQALGNRVSLLPVNIPLDLLDSIQLLEVVRGKTEALKGAHVADLISLGATWMGLLPAPLQALLGPVASHVPAPPFHLVCTNVPGPAFPVYLLGRQMVAYHPYVPIGAEMGLNCAVLSYNGRLYFGLTGDSAAVPDIDVLQGLLDQSFTELCEAAGLVPPGSPQKNPRKRRARKQSSSQ